MRIGVVSIIITMTTELHEISIFVTVYMTPPQEKESWTRQLEPISPAICGDMTLKCVCFFSLKQRVYNTRRPLLICGQGKERLNVDFVHKKRDC